MKLVLTMTVTGIYPRVMDEIRKGLFPSVISENNSYNVKFLIYKGETTCKLICKLPGVKVVCGIYKTEQQAKSFMNCYMKKAMKGDLLYRRCECSKKSFYPEMACHYCEAMFYMCDEWLTEEIEKKERRKREK